MDNEGVSLGPNGDREPALIARSTALQRRPDERFHPLATCTPQKLPFPRRAPHTPFLRLASTSARLTPPVRPSTFLEAFKSTWRPVSATESGTHEATRPHMLKHLLDQERTHGRPVPTRFIHIWRSGGGKQLGERMYERTPVWLRGGADFANQSTPRAPRSLTAFR